MNHTHSKTTLRQQLRHTRQQLTPTQRQTATLHTNRALKPLIRRGHRIGVYWAVGNELCLTHFIRTALDYGAQIYLPYIMPNSLRLWFTPYCADVTQAEHTQSHHRLRIPQFAGHKIRAHQLHTLLLPLVGIDRQGYRLGQGGGYYDATLAHTRARLCPHTVGVGFACQQIDTLPQAPHDIPLAAFVCEQGYQRFGSTS